MANQVKGQLTLKSGRTIRLVEASPPGPPFELEFLSGQDAMGVPIWLPAGNLFATSDMLEILVAIGYLP